MGLKRGDAQGLQRFLLGYFCFNALLLASFKSHSQQCDLSGAGGSRGFDV